ncbi:MAG: NAD(P)H-quinone oxidoreductase [Gemmatimonadota bacterium]
MRAVRIREAGGPEVLELHEVEAPVPGPGEVAVDVRCTALNRADLLQRRGRYPAPDGTRPEIPGLEYAGVVEAVGKGVDDAAVGRRVMGLVPGASYAERIVTPYDQTLPIPEGMDFERAAAIPEAFCTAWDALRQADVAAGDRVLVHAAGSGVGTAALQLARAMGAGRIFGTASAGKLSGIAELGLPLDVPVDYRSESFREVVERETAGEGVDVILELVGAAYWADDVASLARRGRLVLIGLMSGARAETDLATILRRRLRVIGTVMRTRSATEKERLAAAARERLLPWFADGTLVPVVQRVFPLSDAARAHEFMEADRNLGKIVLRIS